MENEVIDILILGSGPAGYTAGIYASRAGYKTVLYHGAQPGGQLTITTEIENFPCHPDGISGPEMMLNLQKQAERFGTETRYGLATSVDFSSYPFKITIDDSEGIIAKALIIATGASAKWLGIPSEKKLYGKGVSACAVCDGFFYKGMDVAIVGGGDSACEEASYLAKMCSKVHMIVRRDSFRASKFMQQRVMNAENIVIHWNTLTDEILGEDEVEAVRVKNAITRELSEIPVKAFFVAIGHNPNSAIFRDYIDIDENGYIKTLPGTTETNIEGVYAAGDVQDNIYRQAITAAGTGCMAALDAERFLAEKELVGVL